MSYRSQKLRASAQACPHCMCCAKENYDGHQLCLAHSNALTDGRGIGHKSDDRFGALVCFDCHEQIDGRTGRLGKADKRRMHHAAWIATVRWWIENGYLVAA